jgi:hypothetical protein
MGGYCYSHGYHPVGANRTNANWSWKKDGHKNKTTWTNTLGGDTFWPSAKRIAIQQNHATWKGKSTPINWQGLGTALYTKEDKNSAAFNKIKQKLSSNFYYCLSLPTCQVKEHKSTGTPSSQPASRHLGITPWICKKNITQMTVHHRHQQQGTKRGNGTRPDSHHRCQQCCNIWHWHHEQPVSMHGQPSHKQFILLDGTVIPATEIAEYPFELRKLAKILHITPGISQTLFLAQSNLQMQTTSQFPTKIQLPSTTPTIQSSPSPKEQSYGDGETRTATYGISH